MNAAVPAAPAMASTPSVSKGAPQAAPASIHAAQKRSDAFGAVLGRAADTPPSREGDEAPRVAHARRTQAKDPGTSGQDPTMEAQPGTLGDPKPGTPVAADAAMTNPGLTVNAPAGSASQIALDPSAAAPAVDTHGLGAGLVAAATGVAGTAPAAGAASSAATVSTTSAVSAASAPVSGIAAEAHPTSSAAAAALDGAAVAASPGSAGTMTTQRTPPDEPIASARAIDGKAATTELEPVLLGAAADRQAPASAPQGAPLMTPAASSVSGQATASASTSIAPGAVTTFAAPTAAAPTESAAASAPREPAPRSAMVAAPASTLSSVVQPQAALSAPSPAAPASAPAPTTNTPSASPSLATQLGHPVFTLAAAGRGEHVMTVHVTPDNLGPVTVRAHVGGDGVRVELFAPTDAGRDALRSILPELRRDLGGAGLTGTLDLSSHSHPGGQQHAPGERRPDSWTPGPRPGTERRPASSPSTAPTSPAASADGIARTIDLIV